VTLQVGQVTQEITVVGQQEIIQSTNADRGLVFDPIKNAGIAAERPAILHADGPHSGRDLHPGAVRRQRLFPVPGGWDTNGSYRINGGRTGTNQFFVERSADQYVLAVGKLAPNVEAIQEFKVQTNTYDAQFGRRNRRRKPSTPPSKAGGSSWHGDVFEYFRTNSLDANTFQNNAAGKPRGKHNQHQFGGCRRRSDSKKDKDFIFGSFEGWA